MILDDDSQIIEKLTGVAQQEAQLLRAAKTLQKLYLLYITGDNICSELMTFRFDSCEVGQQYHKTYKKEDETVYDHIFVQINRLYMFLFTPGGKYDANDLSKLVQFFKDGIDERLRYLKRYFPNTYQKYYSEGRYLYFRRDLIEKEYKRIDTL